MLVIGWQCNIVSWIVAGKFSNYCNLLIIVSNSTIADTGQIGIVILTDWTQGARTTGTYCQWF